MEDIEQTIKETYKTNPEHAVNDTVAEPRKSEEEHSVVLNYSQVVFYDDKVEDEKLKHTYWFRNKQLMGVTGTLLRKAFPDMYKGISKETLQKAADRGNNIHDQVQQYLLFGGENYTAEEVNAASIVEKNKLKIIDTEYLVSDEKNFASAIDLVALDAAGEVILIDIKTTAERHYNAVSLQLSIYAGWFERQNPSLKVKGLYLMWLRDGDYRFEEVPRVDVKKIGALRRAYLKGNEDYVYEDRPQWLGKQSATMLKLMTQIETLTAKLDELKADTLQKMQDEHWYSLKCGDLTISKVAASQSPKFNTAKYKKDHPEEYEQYVTFTQKKEYLTVKKSGKSKE